MRVVFNDWLWYCLCSTFRVLLSGNEMNSNIDFRELGREDWRWIEVAQGYV
jgi:hypothetical protein